MTLFPGFAPEPSAPSSFLSIPLETTSPENDISTSAPPAARRPRRRVVLPPKSLASRDKRDPELEAQATAARSTLKRDAADAIRSVVGQAAADAYSIPEGLPELGTYDVRSWLHRQAANLDSCQEVHAFREAQCGTYDVQPVSCKTRVCPDCERARAGRLVAVVSAFLDQHVPAERRSYVVLTVRNMARLRPGLDFLSRSISSLRRRSIFEGGRCRWRLRDGSPGHPCPTRSTAHAGHRRDRNCPDFRHRAAPGRTHPVEGGMLFTEVTYNVEARTWHPHANLLLDAQFIAQAELADTWRAITCSDAKHRRAGWCPAECDEGSSVVWIERVDPGTVREAVKYVTKATDLIEGDDPQQLVEFLLATRGRRMVQGFGTMFGLAVETAEQPEGETVVLKVPMGVHDRDGKPIYRRYTLARWCRHCGRDTRMADGGCTYDPPVLVPRVDVRLRNGVASWRPPPRRV